MFDKIISGVNIYDGKITVNGVIYVKYVRCDMKDIPKLRNMTAIYLMRNEKILLLLRQGGRVVDNVWVGSAGGHFEEWELNDAKACILREMKEELSVTEDELSNLQLRYMTIRRAKGEIRQNYYFFANLEYDLELVSDEGELKWFDMKELLELNMPFSAKFMVEHYLHIGKYNDKMYVGVADGEKVVFTELPEF